jgi:hypothetical protein
MTLHTLTIFICGLGLGSLASMLATGFFMVREQERREAERAEPEDVHVSPPLYDQSWEADV